MAPQRTVRLLIISCTAISALVFLAMARLATSLPLAIGGAAVALLGPLSLPFGQFSWTPQTTKFVLFSVAVPTLSAVAYVLRPNAITVALATLGFFVWCLCGFAIVTAGF